MRRALISCFAACVASLAACSSRTVDGGPASASGGDAVTRDAGADSADASPYVPTVATFFPRLGATADDTSEPQGPGLVLMGGGPDVDDAFTWAHDLTAGSSSGPRAGDVVVLRASGGDAYTPYLYDLAPFASVQTLLLPPGTPAADLSAAAAIVEKAEVVFFAGGDQSRYVAWKDTPLAAAVAGVHARGGVVGGTSAGCAILGAFAYDALQTGNNNVTTSDAVADPFDPRISFTRHMFDFAPLANAITDTHFYERDRFGRLAAFMARQHADGAIAGASSNAVGIGVDEGAAVLVDGAGIGHLARQRSDASAFVVLGKPDVTAQAGSPLVYESLQVFRLDDAASTFDFTHACGDAPSYVIAVRGDQATPYSPSSPYSTPGSLASCP